MNLWNMMIPVMKQRMMDPMKRRRILLVVVMIESRMMRMIVDIVIIFNKILTSKLTFQNLKARCSLKNSWIGSIPWKEYLITRMWQKIAK